MTPPCKGCDRRKPGCHGRCDQYAVFSAAAEERRAARLAKSKALGDLDASKKTLKDHCKWNAVHK